MGAGLVEHQALRRTGQLASWRWMSMALPGGYQMTSGPARRLGTCAILLAFVSHKPMQPCCPDIHVAKDAMFANLNICSVALNGLSLMVTHALVF